MNNSQHRGTGGNRNRNRQRNGKKLNNKTSTQAQNHYREEPEEVQYAYQVKSCYQIYCSNAGAMKLCEDVFKTIQCLDTKLGDRATLLQLQYCVVLAMWKRIAKFYYYSPSSDLLSEVFLLDESLEYLQLPNPLAKYIECLGNVEVNEARVIPWCGTREEMQAPELGGINPDDLLRKAGRAIPNNYWSIDTDWIQDWIRYSMRLKKFMECRQILWKDKKGSIEMVVSVTNYTENNEMNVVPTCPQKITNEKMAIGACYSWRNTRNKDYWPADTSFICSNLFKSNDYDKHITSFNLMHNYNVVSGDEGMALSSKPYYNIFCSNIGAMKLCEAFCTDYNRREPHSYLKISVLHLQYCVILAIWARLSDVSLMGAPDNIRELKNTCSGLELPHILVDYIESLGEVEVNGVKVVPWFENREKVLVPELGQVNPDDLLQKAGREIPSNYWSIDQDWIYEWKMNISPLLVNNIKCRKINFNDKNGSIGMVVSVSTNTYSVDVTCPEKLPLDDMKVGACYSWRTHNNEQNWPADTALICKKMFSYNNQSLDECINWLQSCYND